MQEEIFGPILPVVSYDRFRRCTDYINARPRPLALYLFDRDPVRIDKVLQQTISGGVCINETIARGAGQHALWRRRGFRHGALPRLRRLSHLFQAQAGIYPKPLGRQLADPAPYGRAVQWLLRLMLRG
jgi:aldehyde dehydrogenase (NAD+)/coniferyl-aldehyde dehydrogenase